MGAPEPKFGNNELTVPCFASRHTLKTWKRSLDSCGEICTRRATRSFDLFDQTASCLLKDHLKSLFLSFTFVVSRREKLYHLKIHSVLLPYFIYDDVHNKHKIACDTRKTRIVRVCRERSCEIYVL